MADEDGLLLLKLIRPTCSLLSGMSGARFANKVVLEERLIFYYYGGEVSVDFLKSKVGVVLVSENQLGENFGVVADVRDASPKWKVEELTKFVQFLEHQTGYHRGKRAALITATPMQTAYSMVFDSNRRNLKRYPIKIFNTVDASLSWLGKTGDSLQSLSDSFENFRVSSQALNECK